MVDTTTDSGDFLWRYLEVAPASTEFTDIKWGLNTDLVGNLSVRIGMGRSNTQKIITYHGSTGTNYTV